VLLGGVGPADEVRFGGTQYAKVVLGDLWDCRPPGSRLREARASGREGDRRFGLAESAHDLSDGGLAVALAESAFGPANIGAQIDLDSDLRPELLLFHEGPSRVLISTGDPRGVIEIAARNAVEATQIGSTIEGRITITNRRSPLVDGSISKFRDGWENALENYVR